MERISIFNYEVFYLDFLEGRLNEEDAAVLTQFLTENPELRMEDEDLPALSISESSLPLSDKVELKQPLLTDSITKENVEFFLISMNEGLLSENKSQELSSFVHDNQEYLVDLKGYSSVYFSPDTSIVYTQKSGLKRKRIVVFWPYAASIAAAIVIAFLLIRSAVADSPFIEQELPQMAASQDEKPTDLDLKNPMPNQNSELTIIPRNASNSELKKEKLVANSVENVKELNVKNEKGELEVTPIERRPVNSILTSLNNQELEPISHKSFTTNSKPTQEKDYASANFDDMKNPIEPITNFIGKTTKTPVDLRTAKKTRNRPGGFYLKIGKFELSKKKH